MGVASLVSDRTAALVVLETCEVRHDSVDVCGREHGTVVLGHDAVGTWATGAVLGDHRTRVDDRLVDVLCPTLGGNVGQVRAELSASGRTVDGVAAGAARRPEGGEARVDGAAIAAGGGGRGLSSGASRYHSLCGYQCPIYGSQAVTSGLFCSTCCSDKAQRNKEEREDR